MPWKKRWKKGLRTPKKDQPPFEVLTPEEYHRRRLSERRLQLESEERTFRELTRISKRSMT